MKTLIALLVAAVALPLGANAAADRSSGTLNVNTTLSTGYRIGPSYCPPGTPSTTDDCVMFSGTSGIPGLGRATATYVKSFDQTICPGQVVGQRTSLIDVAGKGQLKVAMEFPYCADPAPNSTVHRGTIVEGTGIFAGASGSLQIASTVEAPRCGTGGCMGSANDTWTGNLSVPGFEFDLTPPVLQPIPSKRVKAARNAKTVRVRYSPKAQDAVDGPVSVKCKPGSSSLFKVGRTTKVTCTAEDTSANVTTTSFTVTVRKKR
jgi:HYR domain